MKIINLSEKHEKSYFCCLEDWSDEMKEAGGHKETWYHKIKNNGLRVKLAEDHDGKIVGMIQYCPIIYSNAHGNDLYFILCIWVHGYDKGIGNFQKKGLGQALIKAAEDDAKDLGSKGIAAWGLSLPVWMKASWFKKQGYKKVDRQGVASLLWKSFSDEANPPQWIKIKKKPGPFSDCVRVTVFYNGWCPAQNITLERTRRAVSDLNDARIHLEEINTFDRDTFFEWGISDALYINGKSIRTGPPPSYNKIRKIIEKAVRKIA